MAMVSNLSLELAFEALFNPLPTCTAGAWLGHLESQNILMKRGSSMPGECQACQILNATFSVDILKLSKYHVASQQVKST